MLESRWDDCVEIARDQTRDGAHLLDVCVDYVGRDGAADMQQVVGRFATAQHPAAGAGLDRAGRHRGRARAARRPRRDQLGQLRGRRRPRLAVHPHHAGRPRARRRRHRPDHRRGGPGPHPRPQGRGRLAADRRADRRVGDAGPGHPRRHADLHPRHRAGGEPPRRAGDDRGHPRAQAPLPRGADHAGAVQHLVRAQAGRPAGAQLGVPARVRQGRAGLRDRARRQDRPGRPHPAGAAATSRWTSSTTGAGSPANRGRARSPTTRCRGSSSCSRGSTPAR